MLYILNTPVLTNYGVFRFSKVSLEEAKELANSQDFISAVGHKGTAEILSELLEIEIPYQRIAIKMGRGDRAIVFRLLTRIEEGKVLTREELEKLPYELGLLECLDIDLNETKKVAEECHKCPGGECLWCKNFIKLENVARKITGLQPYDEK